jgi:hypothetical protein
MAVGEDLTVRVGLLMEAVESQRALAHEALERLQEHAAGLDAVVRDEVRTTFTEELRALEEEGRRACASLRGLARASHMRLALWSLAIAALAAAVPLLLGWWLLPTPAAVAALRSTQDELSANVARLRQQGGRVELRRCGAQARLCVRIERDAARYGERGEYAVVKGY